MQMEAASRIVARIDARRADNPDGVIAFDCDGTLWTGDVGEDFFQALIAKAHFEPVSVAALRREAEEHGIAVKGEGVDIASRLYDEYLEQRFPEERICEIMAWACAGWAADEVVTFSREVAAGGKLRSRLHAEVIRVLAWAREAGVEVLLVSASPRTVVEIAAREVGVLPSQVIAATPVYVGGAMRPEVLRPIPYGPGKVTRLRERIGARTLLAAFGDNVFDIAMLREAAIPVAVRPKPRLLERLDQVPGVVVIEPER